MKIHFYNLKTESIRVDKENYLQNEIELTGTLKTGTSIINPIIIINMTNDPYFDYNYMYIEEFKRYYFINDVVAVNNQLWQISAHVDVLYSFLEDIYTTKAFINRQQTNFDPMIRDDLTSFEYNKEVIEDPLSTTGSKVNVHFTGISPAVDDLFIVNVINDDVSVSFDEITPPSTLLNSISSYSTGGSLGSVIYSTNASSVNVLLKNIISVSESYEQYNNLSSFIISIIGYPFTIPNTLYTHEQIKLKSISIPNTDANRPKLEPYLVIADQVIPNATSFLDYEPFTQYEIFLPFASWVKVNADDILGKRILIIYAVDYKTGLAQVSIVDDTTPKLIYTSSCQLGKQIPINTTNAYDVANKQLQNNVGLGLGVLGGAVSTIAGVVTYNPMLTIGGLTAIGGSVFKYIGNSNENYETASGSVGSANSGLYLPLVPRIRKTRYIPKSYNADYFSLHGRPYNQFEILGDLETLGYTEVGAVHLEEFENATSTELDEIENLLKSGVIL